MSGQPQPAAAPAAGSGAPVVTADIVLSISATGAAVPAATAAAAPAASTGPTPIAEDDALPAAGPVLKPHNSVQTVDGRYVGPSAGGAPALSRPKSGIRPYTSLDSAMTSRPSQARISAVTGLGSGVVGGPPPSSSSGAGRVGLDPLPGDGAVPGSSAPARSSTFGGSGTSLAPPSSGHSKGIAAHSSFTLALAPSVQDGKAKRLAPRSGSSAGKLSTLPAPLVKDTHGVHKIKMFDLLAPIQAVRRMGARSVSSRLSNEPEPKFLAEARAKAAADGKTIDTTADTAVAIRLPGQNKVLRHHSSADIKLVREHVLQKTDSHSEQPPLWLAQQFGTNLETGLTSAQAAELLVKVGKNELEKDPPEPMWKLFLMQFTDLLVAMLIVAAVIAAALGQYASSIVIIVIVMANAILGLTQESRAGAALEALAALHAPKCEVIRDGKSVSVESTEIVPGDLVILPLGCSIPADIRLTVADGFAANEVPLTGESAPVRKTAATAKSKRDDGAAPVAGSPPAATPGSPSLASVDEKRPATPATPASPATPATAAASPAHVEGDDAEDDDKAEADKKAAAGGAADSKEAAEKREKEAARKKIALTEKNCVYMGCQVVEGNGRGIVVKTGMATKVGEIAKLMEIDEDEGTPLQNKLRALGKVLGIGSILLSLTVFVVGMATGRGVDKSSSLAPWLQMLLITVSLVVAAVPEGLPACVTITLAMGMQKMSEKKAQIRNLRSVETLGSASVICTDKTGTLTCGKMTLVQLWTPRGIACCRFTGVGYSPEGKLLPLDLKDGNDPKAVAAATAGWTKAGNPHHFALVVAALDSQAEIYKNEQGEWDCKGNMSECPIVVGAAKAGYELSALHKQYPKVAANPFSSLRKMSSTIRNTAGGDDHFFHGVNHIAAVKGAPDRLIAKCNRIVADGAVPGTFAVRAMTANDLDEITKANLAAGSQAFRVLAVAYKPLPAELPKERGWSSAEKIEKDLVFLGLLLIIDPERPEVGDVIRRASFAGIRTVMITGDHVITAKAIAENVQILERGSPMSKAADCEVLRGYGTEIIRLEKLIKDTKRSSAGTGREREDILAKARADLKTNQDAVDAITAYCDVYARAQPKDKITIVRSLQRQGHVCSMTGDGVNDAPALRRADIGVAMGKTGTEVARAASAMVLTDDNFVSIVLAIEEGRTIYNNIQKFVFYLLSTNVSEVLLILIGVLAGYPSPLLPIQILWLNLTTDGAPAIALAVENPNPGLMEEGPRNKTDPILEPLLVVGIVIQNVVLTGCCVFTYILGLYWNTGSWQLPIDDYGQDPYSHAVDKGRTMCIIYIVFAELLRAYSSRSLRHSIWQIGWWSNRWMQYGVFSAVILTVVIAVTPGLQDVFGMVNLDGREWGFVIGFSFAPFATDEITKFVYRITGYGIRPRAQLLGVAAREAKARAAESHAPGAAATSASASGSSSTPPVSARGEHSEAEKFIAVPITHHSDQKTAV